MPEETGRKKKLYIICFIAILIVAAVLRLGDFTERWPGKGWQSLGAFFSIIARNYVEQGYVPMKFGPAMNPVPPEDGNWEIYLHHPPLFSLLLSFSFLLFGIAEWSARLLPVVASMIELVFIWGIARHLFGRRVGLVCATLGAAIPVTAFYGSLVIQLGSVLMAFSCGAFLFHLKQIERPERRYFIGLVIMLCGAAMTDWHGYFMGGAIVLHYFWCRKFREALWLIGTLTVLLVMHMLHLYWATGSLGGGIGGSMLEIFVHRTWGGIEGLGGAGEIVPDIVRKFIRIHTWPVVIFALLGVLAARRSRKPMALAVLFLAGLLDHVIFLEGSMRHDFWTVTLAPAFIVLAGAGLVFTVDAIPFKGFSNLILCAAVAAITLFGAYQTHKRFEYIEDDYFYEMSCVIREHTKPDELVGTCEYDTSPLLYYSRRKLRGQLRDEKVPARGLPDTLTPYQKIVISEIKSKPHNHDRMLQLLLERYPCQVVRTPACGEIRVFDVTE